MADVITKQIADMYREEIKQRLWKDYRKVINNTNEKMRQEAQDIFDSFITDFYKYKTEYYIRHGQARPGTGTGVNLYKGSQIKKRKVGTLSPELEIEANGDNMEGGYDVDGDDTDVVMADVLAGIRFPCEPRIEWRGTGKGQHFSFTGRMLAGFKLFESPRYFDKIAEKVFFDEWRQYGW